MMRGHHDPYRCMLCGKEEKTHDDMIEHFRLEHPTHWSYVKRPSELEKEVIRNDD